MKNKVITQKMVCQAVWQADQSFRIARDGWYTPAWAYLGDWSGKPFEHVVEHIFAARIYGIIAVNRYGNEEVTKKGMVIMGEKSLA